jgi:hypothetical protein
MGAVERHLQVSFGSDYIRSLAYNPYEVPGCQETDAPEERIFCGGLRLCSPGKVSVGARGLT